MKTRHLSLVLLTSLVIVAGIITSMFAWRYVAPPQAKKQLSPFTPVIQPQTVIAPPVSPPIKQTETASQISPDGSMNLVMQSTRNNDGTRLYTFSTVNTSTNISQQIYVATLPSSDTMSIPFNTWSPDDKYVFFQKGGHDVLVLLASGEPMTSSEQYYNVENLFNSPNRTDKYNETTGWASPTLLIVNTVKPDNSKGSSYWFEVPSKAVIQLYSVF